MTGATFGNRTRVALQLVSRSIVIRRRIGIWPFCMSRTMTAFTHYTTVTRAHPVQLRIARTRIRRTVEVGWYDVFRKAVVHRHDRRRFGNAVYDFSNTLAEH